jgi:hypothetical protein
MGNEEKFIIKPRFKKSTNSTVDLLSDAKSSYSCNCDYCITPGRSNNPQDTAQKSVAIKNTCSRSNLPTLKRSKSLNFITEVCSKQSATTTPAEYNVGHELSNANKQHHFCFYYYNLWQAELFKVRAYERDNEKLERIVRQLQAKLERETMHQINISLKWRKTVTGLVEENTRLKVALSPKAAQIFLE